MKPSGAMIWRYGCCGPNAPLGRGQAPARTVILALWCCKMAVCGLDLEGGCSLHSLALVYEHAMPLKQTQSWPSQQGGSGRRRLSMSSCTTDEENPRHVMWGEGKIWNVHPLPACRLMLPKDQSSATCDSTHSLPHFTSNAVNGFCKQVGET